MPVSKEIKERGEILIMQENLIELEEIVKVNFKTLDSGRFMDQIQESLDAGNVRRAVRMWHLLADGPNDNEIVVRGVVRLLIQWSMWIFLFGGSVGGWLYLFKFVFGKN